MALYSYVRTNTWQTRRILSLFAYVSLGIGITIFFWTLSPILYFQLFYAPKFTRLVQPIPQESFPQIVQEEVKTLFEGLQQDYTKASVWFPKAMGLSRPPTRYTSYILSIPKLGIANATVRIGSDNLAQSLIHFTGPLPGNFGNPVIFGHSTIPWLYNPTDYKTIFSKLPELTVGDAIEVTADQVLFRYKVAGMHITSPKDLSVLTQNYESPSLTLVTCVPPGTLTSRLVVTATLVSI